MPKFESAMLVVRDPTKSTFSEYTREHTKGHVGRIPKGKFNRQDFEKKAINNFAKTVRNSCMRYFPEIEGAVGAENVQYIHFESLLDKATRSATLKKMASFITDGEITQEALGDAFAHAEGFHRPKKPQLLEQQREAQKTEQQAAFVKYDEAFSPEFAAKFWLAVGCHSCGYSPDQATIKAWQSCAASGGGSGGGGGSLADGIHHGSCAGDAVAVQKKALEDVETCKEIRSLFERKYFAAKEIINN